MQLWEVFYQDAMKGRPIEDTLKWCRQIWHSDLPPRNKFHHFVNKDDEYDKFMAEGYKKCIEKELPLPQELVDWWEDKYNEFYSQNGHNGYLAGREIVKMFGVPSYYASDWNADIKGRRGFNKRPNKDVEYIHMSNVHMVVNNNSDETSEVLVGINPGESVRVEWSKK